MNKYSDQELYRAACAMRTFGGSFAAAIGEALQVADLSNRDRLVNAFPELVEKYVQPVWHTYDRG